MNRENSTGYLATQCQLIQSTAILSLAAERPEMADVHMLRGAENPIGVLKRGVAATISKTGDLINISMESTDPRDASIVVNQVVQAYIAYQSTQHTSLALKAATQFRADAKQNEAELKQTQDRMLDLRRKVPDLAFSTDKGTNLSVAGLAEVMQKLAEARSRAESLRADVSQISASTDPVRLRRMLDEAGLSGVVQVGPDPRSVADYDQASRRLRSLAETLGAGHPLTIRAQHDCDEATAVVSQSAAAAAAAAAALLNRESEAATARVAQLTVAVEEQRKAAVKVSETQAEYDTLSSQAERTGKLLDSLYAEIKSLNPDEDVGSLTVTVLETAKPSFAPVRPQRSQAMGMALVVGLMAGLGGALLRDLSDHRLRSAEEIATVLDLPILGAVPHMLGKHSQGERGQETHLHPRSDVAEAYRTVRTAIYFGLAEQQATRTLLVTSPSPGDGKSTSAANLAIAMAQAGRRVLLIDADCRRPVQHRLFKLHDGPGLSNVLAGRETIYAAIQPTAIERLHVMPCGPLPPNPAELLDSQAFLNLLGEVAALYDQVVLDSPPVVPVTDARILSASCDATILVLRAEKSTRRLAEYAREGLRSVGANLLGVVVNDVPRGKDGYGYYYYGYGGYGAYSAKTADAGHHGDSNGNGRSPALAGNESGGRVADR